MRFVRVALLALAFCILGNAAAAAVERHHADASFPPRRWRTGPRGFYTVPLPATWRFKDASYPSDHATHLWYDPTNPLKKLEVVVSGCVGCVSRHNYTDPYPQGELPQGVTRTYRIAPGKLAFTAYTTDDPYPENGVVIVTRHGRAIDGSITLQLWLPPSQHKLATYILDNFAAKGNNG